MGDLELWKVKDHEGLAVVKKVAQGRLPRVDRLSPGEYVVCDETGNLLRVSVREARDDEAPAGAVDDSGQRAGPPW